MEDRIGQIQRKTTETNIKLIINLDGSGRYEGSIDLPFLDHMIELFVKHGKFDLSLQATGDLHVDHHHTVEDLGLCLGEGINKALGDKKGINRYGSIVLPMDESLVSVALDISGRPFLAYNINLEKPQIGDFDAEIIYDFFKAFTDTARLTLHINLIYGNNTHHIIEAIFKATARALSQAVKLNPNLTDIPSTKGLL
jgi:imidazoleglycerol-phosphate dehydratase